VNSPVPPDPWNFLRRWTPARIGLGRSGGSLPTSEALEFRLDHARARDAVHHEFAFQVLAEKLEAAFAQPVLRLRSQAGTRTIYLQRPDLGRRLDAESASLLRNLPNPAKPFDLAILITDGLSSLAVEQGILPLLQELLPKLATAGFHLAPLCLVRQGRVALQDEAGEILGAEIALSLIGERPGLKAPDSLAAYFVHHPKIGRTDADRNCLSNIRPAGLHPEEASDKLLYLLQRCRELQLSGVNLKDEMPRALPSPSPGLDQ
jgi:ethanolamine ammonia-lyase small subunit